MSLKPPPLKETVLSKDGKFTRLWQLWLSQNKDNINSLNTQVGTLTGQVDDLGNPVEVISFLGMTNPDPLDIVTINASGDGLADSGQTIADLLAALNITYEKNTLTGDVTLTNANQFYDGPSVALAAGTWVLLGQVLIENTSGGDDVVTAKLWDGSTVLSSLEERMGIDYHHLMLPPAIVVLNAAATYKISVAADNSGKEFIRASPATNATGCTNTASWLIAVKIA